MSNPANKLNLADVEFRDLGTELKEQLPGEGDSKNQRNLLKLKRMYVPECIS